MSREIPCPPKGQRSSSGVHGPRNGRMFSSANRPPALAKSMAKTKQLMCRSPTRLNSHNRTSSDPSQQRQQQRNIERLGKKIGTMNLTSPIRKAGGHLRAHTSQGLAQDIPQRILPFQRKPAHIKAMEDCRRPALRPADARIERAQSTAASKQQGLELLKRSQRHCGELSQQLSALAAQMDFALLDMIVAHKGEDALLALRSAFDQVSSLACSFTHLIAVPGSAPSAISSAGGCKSNCMQIKSIVVSLRAIADKLVEQSCDLDRASRIVRLIEQGLIEQLLSWVGECESAYEVLVPEKRPALKGSQPNLHVEQQRPRNSESERKYSSVLRSRKQFIVQPRRDSSGGLVLPMRREREPSPPTCAATQPQRNPSPPVSSGHHLSPTTPYTYSSAPRVCKTIAERRERLTRHRPPMLIIPSA
mmetsp:Transcript_12539/g.18196  ORF Transcript_12539/g.18196 Transcript_12539/m.18196 type:complete len:419 (-) Transcript_12539:147-1403(-)